MWVNLESGEAVAPLRTLRRTTILCALVLVANIANFGVTVYSSSKQAKLEQRVTSIEAKQSPPKQQMQQPQSH